MKSAAVRQSFLEFFREKEHTIVPSSSLLPDSPNLLFTNAGMNQFVPIFLGQRKAPWSPPRAVDTQKCIRAGGKHNDLEDVGLDTYHHTFFEMLGNWSFGDYFKKEAIDWAWELVVDRWGFPPQRLYATVYSPGPGEPSEFDQEAYDHWKRLFQDADLDPKIHIVNGSKADNFWMMGDTGPCGPCSELHVDLTPDGDTRGSLVNKGDSRCIEIWNLVFIQFNANPDGTFTPLPQRHVDTGMGFERVTAIIQGTNNFKDFSGTISNYETDVFRPIFDEIEKLSGQEYASTLPDLSQPSTLTSQQATDVAFRVIADHIRTLSFAIADGIIPSNERRGYVLRRILRRAVRHGRTLGFHEPFFFKLVDVLVRTMGDVFPEVRSNQSRVADTIKREEDAFNRTLDVGLKTFDSITATKVAASLVSPTASMEEAVAADYAFLEPLDVSDWASVIGAAKQAQPAWDISKLTPISGKDAFKLYDTYGFPLDLTELMARERGLTVDLAEFARLMERQRERGRAGRKVSIVTVDDLHEALDTPTDFVGYKDLEAECQVLNFGPGYVQVNRSPLYAEMGGQVGDTGRLVLDEPIERSFEKFSEFKITNTTQRRGVFLLHLAPDAPQNLWVNMHQTGRLYVDADRRRSIQRHHTVTHLLHWALHELVSRDATQKGSYVGPDKLTFDFSSAALTKQQVRSVEKLVNEKIVENAPVSWTEVPYSEAKKRTDIQQFFGEKYGDTVRVVQVGGDPRNLNGYSMELCGGTHVRNTGDIEWFHIVREEAIAAGIRRIEAISGKVIPDWAEQEAKRQQERFEVLSRKKSGLAELPAFTRKGEPRQILEQIEKRVAHLEQLDAEVREWEKQQAKTAEADMQSRASKIANELAASCDGKKICAAEVPDAEGKLLGAIADALKTKFSGPIFLASATNGRVSLLAIVPKQMSAKTPANKIIQETAAIVGGKGGGRPESAQGGGTDATKIAQALQRAKEILSS